MVRKDEGDSLLYRLLGCYIAIILYAYTNYFKMSEH